MGKVECYIEVLNGLERWDDYLLEESGLPGRRANLELLQAVVKVGNSKNFFKYIEYDAEKAPTNSKCEFIAMCGVAGLGRLMSEGDFEVLEILRGFSNDSRWRIREAVAMALQYFGEGDMEKLLTEMRKWKEGSYLEKRALVAALCEPTLLDIPNQVEQVLELLDEITESILSVENRRDEDFKTLRKALGYAWSVAVVALPEEGKQKLDKWFFSTDKDVIWIMKQNLKKNRLVKMDSNWVEKSLEELKA